MTVQQIIDLIAPHLSSDSGLANAIILATQRTSESAFGDNFSYAVALRTSHILTLRDMNSNGVNVGLGGASGSVTSKREGDLAITFGDASSASWSTGSDLELTRYGRELLGLIRGSISGFSAANYSNVEASLYGISDE